MKLSIAYYPEYFPKSDWNNDLKMIKDAGFSAIRFGEFAWSQFEPSEGVYDFSLIDAAIEEAEQNGLKVILCTPTACPPIWLCEKYPEVLPVNIDGRRTVFGARQHRCYNFEPYLNATSKLVHAMGKRYGNNSSIIGWQIDNELGGEQKKCYCDHCKRAFQTFLRDRYSDINDLNDKWGNHFWSQDYQEFEQISTPKHSAMDLYIWQNPAINLEFIHFSSQSIVNFCSMQAEILKKYTKVPVTTNTDTFHYGDTVDLYKLFEPLDVSAIDCYNDDEYIFAFYCDFMRGCTKKTQKKFWVLENGDGGSAMLRSMEIAAERGCEMFSVFKFRPFPWGQEQSRTALVDIYGKPSKNYEVVRSFAETQHTPKAFEPKVGLYYDFNSSWAYNAKSLMLDVFDGLKYPQYILDVVYKSLYNQEIAVDILKSDDDLSKYKTVIAPLHIINSPEAEEKIFNFVRNGGQFIFDTELFLKNKYNAFLQQPPKIVSELFGCSPMSNDMVTTAISVSYGQGRAILIGSDWDEQKWIQLIKESLG